MNSRRGEAGPGSRAALALRVGMVCIAMASVVLPVRADPRAAAATQAVAERPAGAAPAAQAQARGQALYEARCGGCHDRSVHQRSARTAADFAAIRAAVERWDRELGALWRSDEIDVVTRYLNDRFYRFPCSGPACAGAQASTVTTGR